MVCWSLSACLNIFQNFKPPLSYAHRLWKFCWIYQSSNQVLLWEFQLWVFNLQKLRIELASLKYFIHYVGISPSRLIAFKFFISLNTQYCNKCTKSRHLFALLNELFAFPTQFFWLSSLWLYQKFFFLSFYFHLVAFLSLMKIYRPLLNLFQLLFR